MTRSLLRGSQPDGDAGDDRFVEELGVEALCQQIAYGDARRPELARDGYDGHFPPVRE